MNTSTYEELYNRLKEPLKNCKYIYSVYDTETQRLYQLNTPKTEEPEKYFNIVLDERHLELPTDHPLTYYCDSVKDLETIVLYTSQHEDIFIEEEYLRDDQEFTFESEE